LYTSYLAQSGPYDFSYTLAYALSETALQTRKPTVQHMYMHPDVVGGAADAILGAPGALKKVEEAIDLNRLAGKDLAEEQNKRAALKRVMAAPFPENDHRPFAPFARLTFERLGMPFEFRIGAREVAMVYDRAGLDKIAGGQRDADSLFMSGELRLAENRLAEAADLFERSLAAAPEEDLALRAMIKQQLYATHKRLTMACVRGRRPADEVRQSLEMSRAVTTLENEIESLLVIAEAFERNNEPDKAIRCLQKIIDVYGSQEYAVPRATLDDRPVLHQAARNVLWKTGRYAHPGIYGETMAHAMGVVESCLPLYFGALSPVERDLTLTALGLATHRLRQLTQADKTMANSLDQAAQRALEGKSEEEQLAALPLFPGTSTANRILAERMQAAHAALQSAQDLSEQARLRRRLWSLSDVAAACGYEVSAGLRSVVLAPDSTDAWRAPRAPFRDREIEMATAEDTLWLVLRRLDDGRAHPDWLLVTGVVKKRVGFKTLLHAVDLKTGATVWHATEKRFEEWTSEIRLDDAAGGGGLVGGCIVGDTVVVYGLYDVLAFNVADGHLKWRYRVPFDFTIRYPLLSGELMVLGGEPETIALYLGTQAPNGEVAWQKKEQGALYAEPYLHGDRLVSVRKLPFNVTTRNRATGRLLGRIDLPTLSENTGHPLIENGPRALPIDRDAECLIVTDSRYYLMLDVVDMRIVWKRRIDDLDPTREPALRFELKGDYLAVLKEDVDRKALHMLSSRTGELLWRTDPKSQRPQPIYSMLIELGPPVEEGAPRAVLYGIRPHPGQGFYVVGLDAATGRDSFAPHEEAGYGGKPEVVLESRTFGQTLVARVKDRQDFQNVVFDKTTGQRVHAVTAKGSGDFGVAGRASSTVQNGYLAIFALDRLKLAAPAE
jgi:outer membrane protein assembly factor BamB/tetratricopeptide (TPR) repeat protein